MFLISYIFLHILYSICFLHHIMVYLFWDEQRDKPATLMTAQVRRQCDRNHWGVRVPG